MEWKKRALITYIAWPFYIDQDALRRTNHPNGLQSIEIARAFNRLGYIVDIVDWLDDAFIPTNHYDVFFGMHNNFGRLWTHLGKTTVRIYYGTGAYWAFKMLLRTRGAKT